MTYSFTFTTRYFTPHYLYLHNTPQNSTSHYLYVTLPDNTLPLLYDTSPYLTSLYLYLTPQNITVPLQYHMKPNYIIPLPPPHITTHHTTFTLPLHLYYTTSNLPYDPFL